MPMSFPSGRDAFGDPATGTVVAWDRNHSSEQTATRLRAVAHAQPTKGRWSQMAGMFEQAVREDTLLILAGVALVEAQHRMFLRFLKLSLSQTIYFHHFAGDVSVCQLTLYEPQLVHEPTPYAWAYTAQLDIVNG